MSGRVFLGCTSTKQGINVSSSMTQRSDTCDNCICALNEKKNKNLAANKAFSIPPSPLNLLKALIDQNKIMLKMSYRQGTVSIKTIVLPSKLKWKTIEPRHEISKNVVCATSKASDQLAHIRSLIKAFASRLDILEVLSY